LYTPTIVFFFLGVQHLQEQVDSLQLKDRTSLHEAKVSEEKFCGLSAAVALAVECVENGMSTQFGNLQIVLENCHGSCAALVLARANDEHVLWSLTVSTRELESAMVHAQEALNTAQQREVRLHERLQEAETRRIHESNPHLTHTI